MDTEQVKDVNKDFVILGLTKKLEEAECSFKSLQTAFGLRNARLIVLEAEIVQLQREVRTLRELEKKAIDRARAVERKLSLVEITVSVIQGARDAAQAREALAARAQVEWAETARRETEKLIAVDARNKVLESLFAKAEAALRTLPLAVRKEQAVQDLSATVGTARKGGGGEVI